MHMYLHISTKQGTEAKQINALLIDGIENN